MNEKERLALAIKMTAIDCTITDFITGTPVHQEATVRLMLETLKSLCDYVLTETLKDEDCHE